MHEVVQDSSRRALHLPVTVTNTGGLAVAQVGGGKLNSQEREETIDFLPCGHWRK